MSPLSMKMAAAVGLLIAATLALLRAWKLEQRHWGWIAGGWLLLVLAALAWSRWLGWEVGLPSALVWLSPVAWVLVGTQGERRSLRTAPPRRSAADVGDPPEASGSQRLWQFLGAGPLAFACAAAVFTVLFFHLPLPLAVDRAIVGALVVLTAWSVVVTWVMLTDHPRRACVWLAGATAVGLVLAVGLAPALATGAA